MKNQSRNLWSLLCCSLAALGLAGCSGSNVDQLASQGPDGPGVLEIEIQNCGDRAHGDYWFERVPEITVEPLLCSNGSQGTAEHFVEKEYTCAQGVIAETGETRASLEFRNASCEPNSMPGACQPGTTRSCSIANGTGQQVCRIDGTGYDSCVAQSCNTNFRLVDNSCQRHIVTGSSLFTCEAQTYCLFNCANENSFTLRPGETAFCTTTASSGNVKGSDNSNPYRNFSAWIQADYNLGNGSIVRGAVSTTVTAKITCDVNLYRTGSFSWYNFGVKECFYETSGLQANTVRHSIWRNRSAQTGVSLSGQALALNQNRFYPFSQLTKHTNHVDSCQDANLNFYSCPAATYWHTNARTNTDRGDTVIEIEFKANKSWTAFLH